MHLAESGHGYHFVLPARTANTGLNGATALRLFGSAELLLRQKFGRWSTVALPEIKSATFFIPQDSRETNLV